MSVASTLQSADSALSLTRLTSAGAALLGRAAVPFDGARVAAPSMRAPR